jgi:MFS family permease
VKFLHAPTIKQPDLFFARIYYFAFMGGTSFILPFLSLFYISLGFSGKQIGAIASTAAMVSLIAAPVVVNEIKKSPHARLLLQAALVLGAIGYLLLGLQATFLAVLAITVFNSLASTGVAPLSDSMAVSVAKESNSGYGSLRVFGSLGWILILPASGWLIERFGFGAGFSGFSLAWICTAGLVFLISSRHFVTLSALNLPKPDLRATVSKVLTNRTLSGFAVAMVAIGFLNNGVQQFETIYLSQLGASKQLISIAGILGAIVELPFMLISDQVMRRIGPHRMLLIALALTLLQRASVLILPSIPTIMIARFLGGVGFSFYTISFVGLISSHTQPHETGTLLALFTITLAGLVNIVAAPLAGALFDAVGARWLYAFSVAGYTIAITSLLLTRPKASFTPER